MTANAPALPGTQPLERLQCQWCQGINPKGAHFRANVESHSLPLASTPFLFLNSLKFKSKKGPACRQVELTKKRRFRSAANCRSVSDRLAVAQALQ